MIQEDIDAWKNNIVHKFRGYIKMSNLLEKALMELSDGSREEMTDLASITKRMTPCPNCRLTSS
jgi:hypothetical protein